MSHIRFASVMLYALGRVAQFLHGHFFVDSDMWCEDITSVSEDEIMSRGRPSDALALALRLDCPIFVEVLKSTKVTSAITGGSSNEQLRSWLEGLSDEDLGRYKM